MKQLEKHLLSKSSISLLIALLLSASSFAQEAPFTVFNGLFDHSDSKTLGLDFADSTETITVFAPADTTDKFSNGVVMIGFKDWLYCQWQSSALDEDASDTWVAYSRSQDGINWSTPMVLAPSIDGGYCSSGGWWVNGDTLVAYINTWPESVTPRGGYTQYTTSTDGLAWTDPKPLPMLNSDTLTGIFEQDPHALPDGRIIGAAHFQKGINVNPIYTDDSSGIRGWIKAEYTLLGAGNVSRELEPSWYLRSDDAVVMTFRDQNSTFKRLASTSYDRGESWSETVLTEMPDSRSKQSAGNISDSISYLVGNPVNNKTRIPLAVTLSPDGFFFNTAYLLRAGGDSIQPLRYDGKAKRAGYHYPKSMIWNDHLYVSYATNKEDVQFTRVPLESLLLDTVSQDTPTTPPTTLIRDVKESNTIKVIQTKGKSFEIIVNELAGKGRLEVFNISGQCLLQRDLLYKQTSIDLATLPDGLYVIKVAMGSERLSRMIILE